MWYAILLLGLCLAQEPLAHSQDAGESSNFKNSLEALRSRIQDHLNAQKGKPTFFYCLPKSEECLFVTEEKQGSAPAETAIYVLASGGSVFRKPISSTKLDFSYSYFSQNENRAIDARFAIKKEKNSVVIVPKKTEQDKSPSAVIYTSALVTELINSSLHSEPRINQNKFSERLEKIIHKIRSLNNADDSYLILTIINKLRTVQDNFKIFENLRDKNDRNNMNTTLTEAIAAIVLDLEELRKKHPITEMVTNNITTIITKLKKLPSLLDKVSLEIENSYKKQDEISNSYPQPILSLSFTEAENFINNQSKKLSEPPPPRDPSPNPSFGAKLKDPEPTTSAGRAL